MADPVADRASSSSTAARRARSSGCRIDRSQEARETSSECVVSTVRLRFTDFGLDEPIQPFGRVRRVRPGNWEPQPREAIRRRVNEEGRDGLAAGRPILEPGRNELPPW